MGRTGRCRTLLCRLAALLLLAGTAAVADDLPVVTLVEADFAASDLACPANGQTVYCLDPRTGAVAAVDPHAPDKRRIAIGPAPADGPRPLAIACIDTNTLAAVCRGGDTWSIRTWRLRPDATVEFSALLQETAVGVGGASAGSPHLLVGPSRDWLLVAGLPAPLPPVVRGAIAGARVGKVVDRSCPQIPDAGQVVAITANRLDETMLFTVQGDRPARLSFHDLSGRTLLELDGGLPAIHDADGSSTDGSLWVIGGDGSPERPAGLWRLDAAMDGGRQVARPECVARLAAPQAVASVSNTAVVVAHGAGGRTLVRFDLVPRKQAAAATDPGAIP
jgi:hypothetical protein